MFGVRNSNPMELIAEMNPIELLAAMAFLGSRLGSLDGLDDLPPLDDDFTDDEDEDEDEIPTLAREPVLGTSEVSFSNPSKGLDVCWADISETRNQKDVEQVAIQKFFRKMEHNPKNSDVWTEQVFQHLQSQKKDKNIKIPVMCCEDPECENYVFVETVFEVLKKFFEETQYF